MNFPIFVIRGSSLIFIKVDVLLLISFFLIIIRIITNSIFLRYANVENKTPPTSNTLHLGHSKLKSISESTFSLLYWFLSLANLFNNSIRTSSHRSQFIKIKSVSSNSSCDIVHLSFRFNANGEHYY